jgi:membrane-associated phospholipid phosphatase
MKHAPAPFAARRPARRSRSKLSAALALGLCLTTLPALAEPVSRAETVAWRDEWPRFRTWEYVATGAGLLAAASTILFVPYARNGAPGENAFDTAARDLVRAETRAGRDRARFVGDVGYRFLLVYPFVDSLLVAGVVHGSGDVALQTTLLNAEALALTGVTALTLERVVARSRPSDAECARDPEYERFCGEPDRHTSFPTGHTAIAAFGAGVTCAHHTALPLYGGGLPDVAACLLAAGLAVTTGVARVANDRHWATDILAGIAIGGSAGYLLPVVLHYGAPFGGTTEQVRWSLRPFADSMTRSLGLALSLD